MPDSREVFAWPEAKLYLWSGASSGIPAFAESIDITVEDPHKKFLYPTTGVGFGARTEFVQTDRTVRVNIGSLYAGQSIVNLSGVNISATINLSGVDITATHILWSARMTNWQLQGRKDGIFRQTVSLVAADISAV